MNLSDKGLSEKMGQADVNEGVNDQREIHPKKGMEVINLFRKGADFVHDMLKENERLRYVAAKLEEQNESLRKRTQETGQKSELEALTKRLRALEDERAGIEKKFREIEKENMEFANKYVEIEEQNNMLANLYIASYQLHSTLDFNEVLRIVMEIIINLIGAERFAIMVLDEKMQILKAVSSEGIDLEEIPPVKAGDGVIGGTVVSGEPFYATETGGADGESPIVCIPLKIKDRAIGAIVVYSLLRQKDSFSDLDYELFSMLAGHTATALFSSKLYGESERRLSTIQGFIDLITK